MRRRRAAVAPDSGLPVAVLHLLATGEYLTQEAGEARYGPSFNWLDQWTETHPNRWPVQWQTHRAAITQHARGLGIPRPWIETQE